MDKTATAKLKIKKKRWFPIFAPAFLGQKEIGETYLVAAQAALGRILKMNLRDLTNSPKDQNIYLALKIKEFTNNSFSTEVISYYYIPSFVRKLVRKNASKIDDSFILKTKDEKTVRLKPLVVTVFPIKRSAKTVIHKELRKQLKEEVSKLTFDALINDLIRYRLQFDLKKRLKTCPIREVVMRVAKLEMVKRRKKTKELDLEKEPEIPVEAPPEENSAVKEIIEEKQ